MANKATIHDALEADALEIALMKWRIIVCADTDTSPEVLAQIKQRGGINPKHAQRAADLFNVAGMESWWQIYVALKCAAITDGESALNVYDDAMALGWGTSRLKEAIAATKPTRAKRKDAAKCERCERVTTAASGLLSAIPETLRVDMRTALGNTNVSVIEHWMRELDAAMTKVTSVKVDSDG